MSDDSDELFALAVHAAGLGVWEWDIATNRVISSTAMLELFGLEPEKFAGTYQAYLSLIPDEARSRVVRAVEAAVAGSNRYSVEHPIRRADGSVRWVLGSGTVLRDSSGKPTRMLGVVRDITERRAVEQELRESEERFRALSEASLEAIVFAARGRVIDANLAALRLLGCSSVDDLIGRAIREFVHPEDRELVVAHQRSGSEAPYVHRTLRTDGSVLYVEATGRQVTYRGQPVRMTALRDVTGRRQAEMVLRQRDDFIRSIVETSRDWIWAIDRQGQHTYTNPAIKAILGHEAERITTGSASDLMHPDDVEPARRMLLECMTRKVGWGPVVVRWRHADGSYRTLESSAVPILDDHGEIAGFRGVDRDITQRLEIQAEKDRLEEQLRHAQKLEAVGQLAGGIAHDFNNLLTVISGNLHVLAEVLQAPNPDRREITAVIEEMELAADRAVDLTGQLLTFSRRQVSQPTSLDLNRVLKRLQSMLRRLLTENIELRLQTEPKLPNIYIDSGQLEQIIVNLVVNARDAMPDGGTLSLRTSTRDLTDKDTAAYVEAIAGTFVVLSVSDTGTGMPAETVSRVFEPFFTTKGLGRGTGLGLSTVHGIVHQANGFIDVRSEPGLGSTFAVHLPTTALPVKAAEQKRVGRRRLKGSETVLICEDDPAVRRLAARMLSRAGYAVLQAKDGEEALRADTEHPHPIHVLLTDVIMPGMNGQELSEALTDRRPELKTIFFSGYAADLISDRGLLREHVEFIRKPFVREELLERLRQVLDGPSGNE